MPILLDVPNVSCVLLVELLRVDRAREQTRVELCRRQDLGLVLGKLYGTTLNQLPQTLLLDSPSAGCRDVWLKQGFSQPPYGF